MKNLSYLIALVGASAFIVLACTKEVEPSSSSGAVNEKAEGCSCSASSLFNSCTANCKYVNGICVANCTTVWFFGIPFSTCTCGQIGGGRFIATDNIFFDQINIDNLEFTKNLIANYSAAHFQEMEDAISGVLTVAKSSDGQLKADKFNVFFDTWEALTDAERELILSDLEELMEDTGRNQ